MLISRAKSDEGPLLMRVAKTVILPCGVGALDRCLFNRAERVIDRCLRRLSEKDDEGKFRFYIYDEARHSVPGLYLLDIFIV